MISSLIYIALAILGLGFLIFVHELGHYYMARRVGMRVETFSIGLGRPIYSWMRDGVKWQIGILPFFGGFVKIAGQEADDAADPYAPSDKFFGKSPWDRIKVAFMGPLVNIALAFLIFAGLWAMGGREKNFSEFTHKIGWIDPQSELYASGVRPGDEITAYNGQQFQGAKDHMYVAMTNPEVGVTGNKVDYVTFQKTPFEYKVRTYPHPIALEKGIKTTGIIYPANYIIYDRLKGQENPLPAGSPMEASGIQYGDRIAWVDGDLIFSSQQLSYLLNDNRALLTIYRNGNRMLLRVPRVLVEELKLDPEFREELMDWQYEAGLNQVKMQKLYAIPYNLTNDAVVEGELKLIDKEMEKTVFPEHLFGANESRLLPNDKVIAIDGKPISTAYALLANLQHRKVNIIVERNLELSKESPEANEDVVFDKEINWDDISTIASTIGTGHVIRTAGNYVLLNPVTPKTRYEFEASPEKQAWIASELQERKKEAEEIEDPEIRAQALAQLSSQEKQLLLGLPALQDRKVNYNPSPVTQFVNVFSEIWNTLVALISGSLNLKWLSGPVGIVQVVQSNWSVGIQEALFWLGAISLNLGILNLLPIPVLDGGTIVLSLFEMITRKRIHPKTLEKIIIPFALLLIAFFVYVTFWDLNRIFGFFR